VTAARLGLALLPFLAAACVELTPNDTPVTTWEADLVPHVSHPDLIGQVAAAVQLGGTDVGIGIEGAAPGASHLWGVRSGSCGAPGTLIGTSLDYPILVVSDSGRASAQTRLGSSLSADVSYHAELRESTTDTSRIACGNLQRLESP
jgi:hypothetical protein